MQTALVSFDSRPPPHIGTLQDWLAEPPEWGAELIDGWIVYKALPSPKHGVANFNLGALLGPYNRRLRDPGEIGGWWLANEVDIEIQGHGVRPDIVGWRRDRVPKLPEPGPKGVVTERPDWVCEILSPSTASRDLGDKLSIYHRAGVQHYWVVDPQNRSLLVLRHADPTWALVLGAGRDKTLRAEPFDGIEICMKDLFADDEEETQSGLEGNPI